MKGSSKDKVETEDNSSNVIISRQANNNNQNNESEEIRDTFNLDKLPNIEHSNCNNP